MLQHSHSKIKIASDYTRLLCLKFETLTEVLITLLYLSSNLSSITEQYDTNIGI